MGKNHFPNVAICICDWCCSLLDARALFKSIVISDISYQIFILPNLILYQVMKKFILITALTLGLAFDGYSQCPMCKAALTSGRKSKASQYERQVGNGINKGILFLMSVPYVLVAGAGFALYKANAKKKRNRLA